MEKNENNALSNDYRDLIPRNGFLFKFIKKDNDFIHTFVEGDFITKSITPTEMVIGKKLSDFLPLKQALMKQRFYEIAWKGETVNYEGEVGDIHYVASLNPLLVNGEVMEVIGTAIDITDKKRNENKLRELEKLAVVGELAAGIAHEIRNPLTSIIGFTQIISERVDDRSLHEYLGIMMLELERINSIVNEFMFIAKPDETMKVSTNNISSLITSVIRFMEPQSNLKGIRLHFDAQTEEIIAVCDQNLMKQVLINLIQNSIEATDKNGEEIKITLGKASSENYYIHIMDKGTGITRDRLQRLFEPFYTTKEKGTGLGLMICRRIIELHQGTIEFNSDVGTGTEVMIMLPVNIR
ncbi:ATP-binding protein [Peribacillus sp. SI8-4]|uniref:ATP-binding protein n=1 Tax=Peribacillus sp. SI8-4 TaxID=3048009 RepID=UPI0025533531|nr:ATP-binding protein [Peribacillus sp. SI8-4]